MFRQPSSARRNYSWRVVDIVVAALIAIAGGVIFWAWSQGANLISTPVNAGLPAADADSTPAAG